MSALRVVFDTNAFTRQNFPMLRNGPMARLCKIGRIKPIYGHVLMDEMLRAYGLEQKRECLVREWLPFVFETSDRLCETLTNIRHRELIQGHGLKTNIFMGTRTFNNVKAQIPHIPLDGSWAVWNESRQDLKEEAQKRINQKEISKTIRNEISERLRKEGKSQGKLRQELSFKRFLETELDASAKEYLPALIECVDPWAVYCRWTKAKWSYPYFTYAVANLNYMAYYAMSMPNERIDENAQGDLDLMTHLMHADALVSNESGFLKSAFDEIWRPRGKVLFTSDKFCAYLKNY